MELLISRLITLLLVMVAGALLSRLGLIDHALRKGLNRLLFFFVLPIMVFSSMRASIDRELLETSYWPILFGVGLCLANLLVSFVLAGVFRLPLEKRRIFAFLNMFGNNIYLGIPIALALFDVEGVAIVLLYSFGSDLILWSLGLFLLSPGKKLSVSSVKDIFTPTFSGLLLGAAWGVLGWGLPDALANAMDSVGGLASPLALLLTGAALAEIKFSKSLFTQDVPALAIGKLIISPILAALAVSILGLPPMMATLIIILAGMPTFVRSIVLTDQYGWDSQQTATGVLVTTVGSFVSIPLILYFFG